MADPLHSLLSTCCVSVEGRGTGFFVAPGKMLTCAHVLPEQLATGGGVAITNSKGHENQARIAQLLPTDDLALLTVEGGDQKSVILARAEDELTEDEKLLVVGYPVFEAKLTEIASLSVLYDGSSNAPGQRRLQFRGNHVVGGFSGSPLMNLHTGHVVGMVTETRGKISALGGWAIPAETLFEKLPLSDSGPQKATPSGWNEALEERQGFLSTSAASLQPDLQRIVQSGPGILYFGARMVEFVGREAEMAQLESFLNQSAAFSWLLMTGQGGSGKSRLALEFCLSSSNSWRAGFLEKRQIFELAFWRQWRPNRPTLLVVDYAGAYSEALGELVRCLAGKKYWPRFPIRLILIEREQGEWFERFAGKGSSERGATFSAQYLAQGGPNLTIGTLHDHDIFRILSSVAPSSFAKKDSGAALAEFKGFDDDRRALFAVLFAATIRTAGDRQAAIREMLRRERQAIWEPAGCTQEDLTMLALATLVGGATRETLQGRAPWIDRVLSEWNPARFRILTGQTEICKLADLKPNLVGELFVLDWVSTLPDEEAQSIAPMMWSVSIEAAWGFILRIVPDFPEHRALYRFLRPPSEPLRAVHFWASAAVDLTREMPTRYISLGEWLLAEVERVAATLPKDGEIYELRCRLRFNLSEVYRRALAYNKARVCRSKLDDLIKNHPDKARALKLTARALMSDVVNLVIEDENDLKRPLRPAPFTFLQSKLRMSRAQKIFDQLLRKLQSGNVDEELFEHFAAGAFHLVLGYAGPGNVISRVWFPASAMLENDVSEQLTSAERVYRKFKTLSKKMPVSARARFFLARSASTLSAVYANGKREKEIAELSSYVAELAKLSPEKAEIREELARIEYNFVIGLHRAENLKAAKLAFARLTALAAANPSETFLDERRKRAAKLLGVAV